MKKNKYYTKKNLAYLESLKSADGKSPFDKIQEKTLINAAYYGLPMSWFQFMANPKLSNYIMFNLLEYYYDELPLECAKLCAIEGLNRDQKREIKYGYNNGLPTKQIQIYANPKIPYYLMRILRMMLEDGEDNKTVQDYVKQILNKQGEKIMRELIEKVIEWAKERELDKKATVDAQKVKTVEEATELIIGICKNDLDLIKDSIGDVMVTLIIGSMLEGASVEWIDKRISYSIRDREKDILDKRERGNQGTYEVAVSVMGMFDSETKKYKTILRYFSRQLALIAYYYHTTVEECLAFAYEEIKNRKGKMVDGMFVKEQ